MKTFGNLIATKEIEKIKHPAKAGQELPTNTYKKIYLQLPTRKKGLFDLL